MPLKGEFACGVVNPQVLTLFQIQSSNEAIRQFDFERFVSDLPDAAGRSGEDVATNVQGNSHQPPISNSFEGPFDPYDTSPMPLSNKPISDGREQTMHEFASLLLRAGLEDKK
jgi:hypothetical protein